MLIKVKVTRLMLFLGVVCEVSIEECHINNILFRIGVFKTVS